MLREKGRRAVVNLRNRGNKLIGKKNVERGHQSFKQASCLTQRCTIFLCHLDLEIYRNAKNNRKIISWAIKLALCAPWELEADGLADPGCVDRHPDAVRGRTMPAVW